jgi:hypothetical protein
MRTILSGIVVLAAVILCGDAGRPAVAGDQFSIPDNRANFVYRPWGTRYTYRFTWHDAHRTWSLGPRYHYRLRREGFDFQHRDAWAPRVEVHAEGLK